VQQVLGGRVGAEDFERYLHHYLGIQQLVSVVALGGQLVTPQEAQFLYVRDHQELSVQPVYFSASNYLAGVPLPSPGAVAQFYTNEMSAYHVPERVQVRYVAFEMSNSMAHAEEQLTNLSELVEAKFQELGTNYVRFAKTPPRSRCGSARNFSANGPWPTSRKRPTSSPIPCSPWNPSRPETWPPWPKQTDGKPRSPSFR